MDQQPSRAKSPETRRKMSEAAKARHAERKSQLLTVKSQEELLNAMKEKLGLPDSNESIKQIVAEFIPELSPAYVYAVARLHTAALRKKLDDLLSNLSTRDPSHIKAIAVYDENGFGIRRPETGDRKNRRERRSHCPFGSRYNTPAKTIRNC